MHSATILIAALGFMQAWRTAPRQAAPPPPAPELVSVERIWSQARHNAYPDVVRFKGRWYCALREGQSASSADGSLRLLTSADGERWQAAVLLPSSVADLREPKMQVTPDNKLLVTASALLPDTSWDKARTVAWFSSDGRTWGDPVEIGDPGMRLGHLQWELGRAYGTGYSVRGKRFARLYVGHDGSTFTTLVENLYDQGTPTDGTLMFLEDSSALCLLTKESGTAVLGRSRPPYRSWTWQETGLNLEEPQWVRLGDGRIVVAGTAAASPRQTALYWLDPATAKLTRFLKLPSGGDNGCPGLVVSDGLLWVAYHSSHEGKTAVYLAKVKLGK